MRFLLADATALTGAAIAGAWLGSLHHIYAIYAVVGGAIGLYGLRRAGRSARGREPESLEPPARLSIRDRFRLPWPVWRMSLWLRPLSVAGSFAALFVHYRVLAVHGAEAAGILQVPLALGVAIGAVWSAGISVIHTPDVARGGSIEERMARADRYQRVSLGLFVVGIPFLLVIPELAIRLLYADTFLEARFYIAIFAFVAAVRLVSQAYQAVVIALDRMSFHVAENFLIQLAVIGIAIWGIDRFGILGAALALGAEPLLLVVCTLVWLRRREGVAPTAVALRWWPVVAAQVAIAGWIGVGSGWDPWVRLGLAFPLAAFGLLMLPPDERSQLWTFLRPWRRNSREHAR